MEKIASVQLYSLRQELAQDFTSTIQQLAEIGYPTVEGYNGMPLASDAIAEILKEHGLKMPSCHLPLPFADDEKKVMQAIEQYNLQYAIVPSQPREDFTTIDGVKRVCERLNRANEIMRNQGVTFGYHNHEFEFANIDGQIGYDIMLNELEPSIILELDVYWAQLAGHDPIEIIQRLGTRSTLIHIKDGPANSEKRNEPMVALGKGNVDLDGIIAASDTHTKYLVVELDNCATDMMTAMSQSYDYLREKEFINGNN